MAKRSDSERYPKTKAAPEPEPTYQACLDEFETWQRLYAVAIAKVYAAEKGLNTGQIPCPICKTGMLKFSIAASNGHARVYCARVVGRKDDGQAIHCLNAME